MSTTAAVTIAVEERAYYLATAMLTTAFDYGRDGDLELWWATFLPLFTAWIDAAYAAFVGDRRLNMSGSKLGMIAAAIANFLPRLVDSDRRRWIALKEAVDRALASNVAAGVSGDIVRIGLKSLRGMESDAGGLVTDESVGTVEPLEIASSGEEQDDGSKVASPIRRSSRRSVKAEKLRVMEEDVGGEDSNHDEEADSDGHGDESDGEDEDMGDGNVDKNQTPREKTKSAYLRYDATKHFFWAKACQYCSNGNWICFGDVYLTKGKLSSSTKCQSCVILRKPCVGGTRKDSDTVVVKSPVPKLLDTPPPRRKSKQATGSIITVPRPGEPPLIHVPKPPLINLGDPSLSRKRSALAPPTSAVPSSSKVLRPAQSSSAIRRTSSAISSSPSVPSPLVFSPSLPFSPSSSSQMVVDPPEDQFLILLDALEFALDRGNVEDVRKRIRALRALRRREKGYPSA